MRARRFSFWSSLFFLILHSFSSQAEAVRACTDSSSNNESAVWERLGELEQANSELQQKQLEFEREKYDLHKQIAQLQRKLEKRTLCRRRSRLILLFSLARCVNSHTWRRRRRRR